MKILITGTSGFLGRRAAASFKSNGYEVLTPSHAQLELCDGDAVLRYLEENRPDGVIHCAAVSDTGKCQQDPEGSAQVNVDAPANLAAACARTGAKLVFCSSDQVYAGSALPGPHSEAEPVTPGNVYGRQKLLAEQRCGELCPDTVSLRLSWMYSAQLLPDEHGHFLTVLRTALEDPAQPLRFPIHDRRGITDAAEVIANLPAALALPGGVYNFGSENTMDTYHTVRTVLEKLGLTDALNRLERNEAAFADAPRDIRMDTSRISAAGIRFSDTAEGICRAVPAILSR